MSKLKGNLLVAQSGGPTAVINCTLQGVVEQAMQHDEIEGIYGAHEGIKGFMEEDIFDLRQESAETIAGLRSTSASILNSCRYKVGPEDLERIFNVIEAQNIRYFFIIGGNDTQDTANEVSKYALAHNYDLRVAGLPKTIDNDLMITDHSPGYGSAARYAAITTMDLSRELESLKSTTPVTILETFGQTNGWLAGAAALAKQNEDDGPHLIYTSEKNLPISQILSDIEDCYRKLGKVLVVVGEGVSDNKGVPLGRTSATAGGGFKADMFGDAANNLRRLVVENLGLLARCCVPGAALQCSITCQSQTDADEAYEIGRWAVRRCVEEQETDFMPAIVRDSTDPYRWHLEPAPLEKVANDKQAMPKNFINDAGNYVTEDFLNYLRPLVGPLPKYSILKGVQVANKL